LPAGIGAKLAAKQRPVVVLIGDGGLQFTIAELASAVEAEVPLIVLLWNNCGYGEIKSYMVDRRITPIGVDIFTPDFLTIARGFGCAALRPDSDAALIAALREAEGRRVPTVIELRADAAYLR
jgi:acetolactate synthase-1/2/3 large subunit